MRKPLLYIAAQGVVLALLTLPAPMSHSAVRIKDLARFDGVREQPIIGYGIVVGLSGTRCRRTRSRAAMSRR
jgi:flagellar P-ring protein precursor FlgI